VPKTTRTGGASIAGGTVPRSEDYVNDVDLYLDGKPVAPGADVFGHGIVTTLAGLWPVNALTWGGANEARYARAIGRGTISRLRIHVTVQSGNISLAVYSPAGTGLGAIPGVRKATTGAIACPGTGAQDIAIGPVLVEPGDFLAMSCDNTTASFLSAGAFGASALFAGQLYVEAGAHPLPATPNPVAHNQKHPMLVGVP
jgi:hypothetical protein